MSSIYINDVWNVYFHDPYDMNWDVNSYKFITTISSVEDFVNVYKSKGRNKQRRTVIIII